MGSILLIVLLIILSIPIIAIKKKHNNKVPIIIVDVVAFLLLISIMRLGQEGIAENTLVTLAIVAGLMLFGSFVWCFITPKNKE